jgi:hypothetical protein
MAVGPPGNRGPAAATTQAASAIARSAGGIATIQLLPRAAAGSVPSPTGIVAGLAVYRRRRGKPPARAKGDVARPGPDILAAWADAGESHAALVHWEHRLALQLRQAGGLEEMARVQRVLEGIALAAYEPRAPARLAELCVQAAQVEQGR